MEQLKKDIMRKRKNKTKQWTKPNKKSRNVDNNNENIMWNRSTKKEQKQLNISKLQEQDNHDNNKELIHEAIRKEKLYNTM